jgi:hypothetical protein
MIHLDMARVFILYKESNSVYRIKRIVFEKGTPDGSKKENHACPAFVPGGEPGGPAPFVPGQPTGNGHDPDPDL